MIKFSLNFLIIFKTFTHKRLFTKGKSLLLKEGSIREVEVLENKWKKMKSDQEDKETEKGNSIKF